MWRYLSGVVSLVYNLALQRGSSLWEVMAMNQKKLDGLHEGGFSAENSLSRGQRG